jgi:hypothetical protein
MTENQARVVALKKSRVLIQEGHTCFLCGALGVVSEQHAYLRKASRWLHVEIQKRLKGHVSVTRWLLSATASGWTGAR